MADLSCQSKPPGIFKVSLVKIYFIIAMAVVIIIACLGYAYWVGNEMVARQSPEAKVAVQLQLDVALAHLRFEEILSEDSDIDLDEILAHLDLAQTYTQALLTGGDTPVGKIMSVRDPRTRMAIDQIQSQLTRFRQITLERWENQATSGIGSATDQTYDQVFRELLDQAQGVQESLNHLSARQLTNLKTIRLSLMGMCLLTALCVGALMTRMLVRQVHDHQGVLALNQQLEASNQQLRATEQQLRATNQQLKASDQQMRAVNQQLVASEQQIHAERDRAQRYFNQAGTMLIVLDSEGHVGRINQKGCEVLGAEEDDIVGKDWFHNFLPESMCTPTKTVFDQLVSGEVEPVEFYENPVLTARGEQRLVAWHNTLLRDDKGSIVGILISGEDITDRRQAERDIQIFKHALDSSTDAIGMSTPEGRHVYQNQMFDVMFGEIGEDPPASAYVDESAGRKVFDTVMSGYEWTGEVKMFGKDRTVLNILLRAYPVKEEDRIIALVGVHTDITERIRAEASLRESQRRLRQLIDAAPYGAHEYQVYPDDRLVFVGFNQAANRILNTDCADFIGKTIEEAFPPLTQTEIPQAYHRVATTGQRYEDEQVVYSHEEITGAFEISAFQTGPQRMAVFFRDITERKRATEALEKERNLIVRLMETSPVGITMTDATGQIRFANLPAEHILGLTKDEIVGCTYNDPKWHITDYDGNPLPEEHLPFVQVRDKLEPVYGVRHAVKWPDGRRTLLSVNAAPLIGPDKQFSGMVALVEDVTERVHAEKKVLHYQKQLRALVSQLTLSEERERKRLAVELHDGICQSLAMAKLKVDEQLVNDSLCDIQGLLKDMQHTLVSIIHDTRSLTNNLGTPMLQQMGLNVAIEKWLDTEISTKHGIKTEVIDRGVPKALNEDTKALLFRAVRELAINVVKHAQARTLTVSLDMCNDELHLEIQDDGKGFHCPELTEQDFRHGGYGLFSIYERITYIGGSMTIDSSPGKGTRILLRLPLSKGVSQGRSGTQAL